jgi:hypothetical protein
MAHTLWKIVSLGLLVSTPSLVRTQEISAGSLFADSSFDRWSAEAPVTQIPWKVQVRSRGLSQHQRLVAEVEIAIKDRELAKRARDGRLVALVRVTDEAGNQYRDFGVIDLKEVEPGKHSTTWVSLWEAFVLPGDYKIAMALYDKASGEHSFQQSTLHVPALKKDPLPEAWAGLPAWEFWAPITDERDAIFHSDITSRLHLPLRTKRPVELEILADLTPSDLFHGSTRFYTRYLSVMLPLLKALSQITPSDGSVHAAAVDLRERRVTFEQDSPNELDWARLKAVTGPGNGPEKIPVSSLQQMHESPDFLRDELLRRLDEKLSSKEDRPPLHVIVVLGSPMDFYAFHHFPPVAAEETNDSVVYYLQFETYGRYADGALGKVRSMLKPLPVRTIKVRSAESVRQALARILNEVPLM